MTPLDVLFLFVFVTFVAAVVIFVIWKSENVTTELLALEQRGPRQSNE